MIDIVGKIGYQALFDEGGIVDAVDFAAANRFRVVEINLNSPNFFPESLDRVDRLVVRDYSRENGVKLILHAPEGMGVLNLQTPVRMGCVERLKELVDFGCQIGADRMTYHVGASVPMLVCGERIQMHTVFEEEHRQALTESLSEIARYSKDKLYLCVENTGGFRYEFVKEILAGLLGNGLSLTWDLGHTHFLKGGSKERETEFFVSHLDKVRVTHIHDNHGSRDEHNVIGDGSIDFSYYLSLIDPSVTELIFEVRPRENAIACRERLRKMLADGSR